MLTLRPEPALPVGPTDWRHRVREATPVQLGAGYLAFHLAFGWLSPLVITPGGVSAGVVFPAWIALVGVLAFLRDDDPIDAGALCALLAAVGTIVSLTINLLTTNHSTAGSQSLLFGFSALPPMLGAAAGINGAIVVMLIRFFRRFVG